ncbi:MAG: fibronectin type III domain-containing protein, partial [Gammaproteobacteria bacterium]|nr:fibronectin type III domain-containing protein [Gammaproteobacteria bacterium]
MFTRTDDSLSLRWGAPHDGGRDITGYKVRWADASSPANYLNTGGASGVDADADARRYVLENLTAGTTYQAQVRAVNSIGDGDWSEVQERILPVKSGIKMAICIHPVGAPPATFDECLQAARNGYTINQSASGAQQFKISAFSFTAPPPQLVGFYQVILAAVDDPANPLVADTDTDGALPGIHRTSISQFEPLEQRETFFPTFSVTPKASGDGGRINITVDFADIAEGAGLGDGFSSRKPPAEEVQGTFLQLADASVNFTAPDSNNTCPATNNAAVSNVEVAENGNATTVCVSLKSDPGETVSVSCAAPPNALGEAAVSATPAKLSFTSGNHARGQALALTAPDNNSAFGANTETALRCDATGGIGLAYSGVVETLAVAVTDTDAVSTSGATLGVSGNIGKSGGAQEVEITATLGGSILPGTDCTVTTAIGSTAITNTQGAALAASPTDYTAFTAPSITIPAGKTTGSATVAITPNASGTDTTKSIPITATAASCGGSSITFAAAEVLIIDAAVLITDCNETEITTLELEEGGAAKQICVKLDGTAPSADVTVTCSGAADPAVLTSAQTGTFTSANHETEQTFPIVAVDNNLAFAANMEPTDTLTCTAVADAATGYSGLTDEVAVTVKDDTAPDTISTAGATLSFTHAAENQFPRIRATATLSGAIAPAESCTVTLTKGSEAISGTRGDVLAVEGTDYTAFTAPSITIPAGSLSGTAEFLFETSDYANRDKKSIPFSGAAASCGGAAGSIAFAEAEILILDTSPLATQADADGTCPAAHNDPVALPLSLTEGTPVAVCISLPLDPAVFDPGATPQISCSGRGQGTHTILDGQSTPFIVAIAEGITGGDDGDWNLGRVIGITEPDDNIAEGDRTIGHSCNANTDRMFGPYRQSAQLDLPLSITDDDTVATTGTLSGAVIEGGGAQTATVTATLDGEAVPPSDCAVTVSIGASAITGTRGDKVAAANTHYTGTPNPSTITIAGREASGDMTFSFTPVVDGDNDIESIPLTATAACGGDGVAVNNAFGEFVRSDNGSDTITFTGEILIGDAA